MHVVNHRPGSVFVFRSLNLIREPAIDILRNVYRTPFLIE